MSCVAVHVDTKAIEFEIAMQISFLMIFSINAITTNYIGVYAVHSFIHLLRFANIIRKKLIIRIMIYPYFNFRTLLKRHIECLFSFMFRCDINTKSLTFT